MPTPHDACAAPSGMLRSFARSRSASSIPHVTVHFTSSAGAAVGGALGRHTWRVFIFVPWEQVLPHSLHLLFRLPCAQMPLPPHSLQFCFHVPCEQKALPTPLFAPALPPPVRAEAAAAARFTLVFLPPMHADATAATISTPGLLSPVFAFRSFPRVATPRRVLSRSLAWRHCFQERPVSACSCYVHSWTVST